jgi:CRAL/TRIO domain
MRWSFRSVVSLKTDRLVSAISNFEKLKDKKSRETGFLCKQIAIIDLEGFSVFNFDSKFSKVIGQSSHMSQMYYPQLLGKTVIINMPITFRVIYKAMSVFMPASTLEKQAICPANTLKKSAGECPFLKNFKNGVEIMPPFLGGSRAMMPELTLDTQ